MVSLRSLSDSIFGQSTFSLTELNNDGSIKNNPTVFTCDAVATENYSKTATVSSYPVEDGNDISDQSLVGGFRLSLNGVVSDSSMSYFDIVDGSSIAGTAAGGLLSRFTDFENVTKSQKAWNVLDQFMVRGQPLMLKSKYFINGYKENNKIVPFVIESLNVPRNAADGQSLRFSIGIRSMRLVRTDEQLVDPLSDKGAQPLGSPTDSKALSSGNQATTQKTEQLTSLRDGGKLKVIRLGG